MAHNDGRTLTDEEKQEFAYELALGYFDDEGLRIRFGLSARGLEFNRNSPTIQRMVQLEKRKLDESDDAMRIIARKAARIAIADLAKIVEDDDASVKARMDASKQLREFATIVDRRAIEGGVVEPVYIATNLDLGSAGNGVYALTAREAQAQADEPNPEADDYVPDRDDISDLLGV